MTSFTHDQAIKMRDRVLAHVGAIRVDKANPGVAGIAVEALHLVLSFFSVLSLLNGGTFVPPDVWRQRWSQTIGVVVLFATDLSDDDVALVAIHEARHVLQFKQLGFTGLPADKYSAAMWVVYLFSAEGRARLEAEAFGVVLEVGIKLLGWSRDDAKAYIVNMRDVALPNYGLSLPERELAASILDSQATSLFSGTSQVSELGAQCVRWGHELGVSAP